MTIGAVSANEPSGLDDRESSHGSLRKRAVWIIADQALSSLSNAGLTIGLARVVSPTQYGAFALAFTVYSLVLALSQSVTNQVLVIGYSGETKARRSKAASAGAGAALAVGLVSMLIIAAIALATRAPIRETVLAGAVVLPALLLQDFWRTVFVAFGTPQKAFLNDLVWTALWALAFAVFVAASVHSAVWFLLAWGAAGLIAALMGIKQAGAIPAIQRAKVWLLGHRDTSVPSFANVLATLGSVQIGFLLIAGIGGVEVVGSLRATQTLLGPLNIVGFALGSFAVPEIVRRNLSRRGLFIAAIGISGLLVAVAVSWGSILLLLPDSVGRQLLGDTWTGTRETLPGLVIYYSAIVATTGATAVMRALNRMRSVFITSILLGPLVLICSVVGVKIDGAQGAAYGFALAAVLVIVPSWALLVRDVKLGRRAVADVL